MLHIKAKYKLTTKLTQEIVVYQIQFQINQMIETYGYETMHNMFNYSQGSVEMFRHYSNLMLTYNGSTVWTVIGMTFKIESKVG
jgi:hypothetical protein